MRKLIFKWQLYFYHKYQIIFSLNKKAKKKNKKNADFIDNASNTNSTSYRCWPQGVSKVLKGTWLIIRAELSKRIRSQAHED